MANEKSSQPDPVSDIGEMDIDALLEKTSALAEKAGTEVGIGVPKPSTDDAVANPPATQETPATRPPPADKSPAEPDGEVDAEMAKLESLLHKMGSDVNAQSGDQRSTKDGSKNAQAPASDQPKQPVRASANVSMAEKKHAAPSDGKPPGLEDYDDFDISVDLSMDSDSDDDVSGADEDTPEHVGAEAASMAPAAQSLLQHAVAAGFKSAAGVLVALDRPFAKLSPEIKHVIGYVAIVTLVMATAGLIYAAIAYH